VNYARITREVEAAGLLVMGALHPARCAAKQLERGTLILLGAGPRFWWAFCAAREATDGAPDPIDRWSTRVVGGLAECLGGQVRYPFGGPPYAPFIDWALKSGRAFTSPTGMLVHDRVGLMISYRGALHFDDELDIPVADGTSPCDTCEDRPCTTSCPVRALRAGAAYDLRACHGFLDTGAGSDCMAQGCAVRRACPLSKGAGRKAAQSALHMRSFHPGAIRG
jgi:hypothetical protein